MRFSREALSGASRAPPLVCSKARGSRSISCSGCPAVATLTRKFVSAVAGTKAVILDTRKTTPGLRILEKYAVCLGGGRNHRFGLFDGVLIKENHITASGSVKEAVRRARSRIDHLKKIEIEVTSLEELSLALEAGADVILLDNMDPSQTKGPSRLSCRSKSAARSFRGNPP